ncbi:MAG: regulatory protein RecX [Solirubrobacteraceae bacterium]
MTGEPSESLQRALELGCAYLNSRERTVSEVRSQLRRKGAAEALIDACLRTLVDQGLLDDARFSEMYVADKRQLEQWGSERIRRGLIARGIEPQRAAAAVSAADSAPTGDADTDGGHGELGRALALLARRFPSPPSDRRERERALGLLLRKGYESELAFDALSAYARGD